MGPVEREDSSGARATVVAPLPVSPVPFAIQVQVDERSKGNPVTVYPDDVLNRHKWLKVL